MINFGTIYQDETAPSIVIIACWGYSYNLQIIKVKELSLLVKLTMHLETLNVEVFR